MKLWAVLVDDGEKLIVPSGALIRDLRRGLNQQMYFWGKDVVDSGGNFFVREGFERRESKGLTGTSCYSLEWMGGHIHLAGSQAGWLGENGGVFFIRPLDRLVQWMGSEPPVPGRWLRSSIKKGAVDGDFWFQVCHFLDWWLFYERRVEEVLGRAHREEAYLRYRKVQKSRPWLKPELGIKWVQSLRSDPTGTLRSRAFAKSEG